jgi:hypothetical protein
VTRLVGALALAGVALLGCSSCPAPTSTAAAPGAPVTLDAAAARTSYQVVVEAPGQRCGCRWCDEPPTISVTFAAQLQWSSPADAPVAPVVRFALVPAFVPSDTDALDPPLPLDVVLTAAAPSSAPVLQATHLCEESGGCDLVYQLIVSRVEATPAGAVSLTLSVDATYPSIQDGSLRLAVAP